MDKALKTEYPNICLKNKGLNGLGNQEYSPLESTKDIPTEKKSIIQIDQLQQSYIWCVFQMVDDLLYGLYFVTEKLGFQDMILYKIQI